MEMVNVIIDGKSVEVEKGSTVLLAAQKAGVHIPTLCYLKDVNAIGACRVCLVEVKGAKALQPACVYPVSDGLEVHTNTPKVREARKAVVELLLSNHPADCLTCVRSGNCELQTMAQQMGIREIRFEGEKSTFQRIKEHACYPEKDDIAPRDQDTRRIKHIKLRSFFRPAHG